MATLANKIIDNEYPVQVLIDDSTDCSIGVKRNRMMAEVTSEYMAFFDDDDRPGEAYISSMMEGINKGVDCCSLNGIYTLDGKNPQKFIHSIRYTSFFEEDKVLYRCPNHLNCIKTELAKQCEFPDWKYSEDSNFAFQLRDKGLLKTEHQITDIIYYYDCLSEKGHA